MLKGCVTGKKKKKERNKKKKTLDKTQKPFMIKTLRYCKWAICQLKKNKP